MSKYWCRCGLLLLPIFVWNAVMARRLPGALSSAEFWRDVPTPLMLVENALRPIVATLPFFMPLELTSVTQRRGLLVYGAGSGLYYASWFAIVLWPGSAWTASLAGSLAPAYTPLVWLAGVALLGQRLYWGHLYRWWMYLVPAAVFIVAHVSHAALVYVRHQ